MIYVGVGHNEYWFETHRDLEVWMGENGLCKKKLDWYDEDPKCAEIHGFHCSRLDLRGGEEPCEVCKHNGVGL